jgi:hypothetical protein
LFYYCEPLPSVYPIIIIGFEIFEDVLEDCFSILLIEVKRLGVIRDSPVFKGDKKGMFCPKQDLSERLNTDVRLKIN